MDSKNNPAKYVCKYSNGAELRVIYYPEADPKFPYEDRIELSFLTEDTKTLGVRMTFAEAIQVIQNLSMALNQFLDDKRIKSDFDVPLAA